MKTEVNGFLASTCFVFDHWETCIFSDDRSEVVAYAFNEFDADRFHSKYVDKISWGKFKFSDLDD